MLKIANNDRSLRDLVSELLADAGYTFQTNINHGPSTLDVDEPRGYWFAWATQPMVDCKAGDTQPSREAAERDALRHWFANARVPMADDAH